MIRPNRAFAARTVTGKKAELLTEVATRSTAGGWDLGGWLGLLPDPDPVLVKRGDQAEVLDELLADDQVTADIQRRKVCTLNKQDWKVDAAAVAGEEPSPLAVRLAKDFEHDLAAMKLRNVISEILDAPYFGRAVLELIWTHRDGQMRLANIVAKPRRWFSYDTAGALVFTGEGAVSDAQPVDPRQFVVASHYATYDNPYGLALLSRCLWPVAFKRAGVQWWMTFAEKYGIPWVVGRTRPSATLEEQDRMADQLASMVADAVAVVSAGSQVDIHETKGKAGDLHKTMVTHWDRAISKLLQGQTLTADVDGKGSYAASQTHMEVLDAYAEADQALAVECLYDVGKIYALVRASDSGLAPEFGYVEPEDYQAQADLDTKLKGLGVIFRKVHFLNRYGLAEEEFDVAPVEVGGDAEASGDTPLSPDATTPAETPPADVDDADLDQGDPEEPEDVEAPEDIHAPGFAHSFADDTDTAPDDYQDELDDFVEDALRQADGLPEAMLQELQELIGQAETLEDLHVLLAEWQANQGGDDDGLAELLHLVMINADLHGRAAVKGASDG